MRKTSSQASLLRRSALSLAISLSFATLAYAQSADGSITGQAAPGASITIENKAFGLSRSVSADKNGGFAVSSLPPGTYTVRAKGADGAVKEQVVTVVPGTGVSTDFVTSTVEVTGRVTRIDVKSPESSITLSKEKIDRIPVAHDATAIALLAPGAIVGDARIGQTNVRAGNVPSLGGASPAENVYYINGFNVTNSLNGVAFNQVPYEAIASQQVKTGGYGPEYGRSLGGVLSVTTKRGTNEWHGGVNVVYSPESLSGSSIYTEKDASGNWVKKNRPGGTDSLLSSVWAGGPLIEDRLFFFGMIQGSDIQRETYGVNRQEILTSKTPQYLAKIDWNLNSNNLVEFTYFSDKTKDKTANYVSPTAYGTARGTYLGQDEYTTGGENAILKYTTWLTDDLTVSLLAGQGKYNRKSNIPSSACPFVRDDRTTPRVNYGCWTQTSITDPNANDKRTAYRADAEWVLGAHTLRFGADYEEYSVVDGTYYPGGERYQIKNLNNGSTLANGYRNTTGAVQQYIEVRHFENGGVFKTKNSAFYIEDSYQVTKNVLANVGVRSESFNNLNSSGQSFIEVKNTIAPRLGVTWDVNGNASTKLFANAGRYYIPVMSNTNVRLAGTELDWREFYVWNGTFGSDAKQIPGKGAMLGSRLVTQDGSAKDPRTVVDPNIKPMYQDEFIVGFQQALANRWVVGAKVTHRNLKSVMDDMCNDEGAYNWAIKNGYNAAKADAIATTVGHCFLYNPGKNLTANVDFGDGKLTAVTIPAESLAFPQPKRTYNAVEFSFERPWDGKWSLQGSYVLAYSKGNSEGYVKSDIGQDDAGISQDWDYPGLMEGSNGYLPNDRRHSLKLWGSYQLAPEWRVGANALLQSGRPKNCLGYYAGNLDGVSILYGAASFYCNSKLNPRGTIGRLPWTQELSLQTTYTPGWMKGLSFTVDVLNVFNKRGVISIEEGGESAQNTPNPAYQQPLQFQRPRTFRFTGQYEF